ncbi:phosphatase PAP2 family protein [Pontibacter ruber]|uniref:Phosphatase PAP2 family protein n=1 Tax=Pontibacter ruber TaxID=1343895 RepID=A0ABW5CX83_9BACT|nr:phosphatase PAP2 family protein [Pontibacter ruber]
MKIPLLLLLFLSVAPARAQYSELKAQDSLSLPTATAAADTNTLLLEVKHNLHPLVRKSIMPSVLIGLGLMHLDDEGFFEGSRGVRNVVQRNYSNFSTRADDHTRFVPVLMAAGLNIAGVKGEHHVVDQVFLVGMTYLLNRTLSNNLKSLTAIKRPGNGTEDAFPSEHTSSAFAYATFFHKEYGRRSVWYSVAGYSFATATGVMRILNDRHWLSDVLAGAGIGILSAEVVYLVYPVLQRKIISNYKEKHGFSITPFYSQAAGGLALLYRLP